MNFTEVNLDLQSTMRRIYASLLYRSSSMKLANRRYMEGGSVLRPLLKQSKLRNKWLNPEWLISDEQEDGTTLASLTRKKVDHITYEWKLCQDIYNSIKFAD